MGPNERYCAHSTLSMSKASYREAIKILDEAREKIVSLALQDKNVEQVYEVILQQFPLSKDFKGVYHE
jgi:hypothetical protein